MQFKTESKTSESLIKFSESRASECFKTGSSSDCRFRPLMQNLVELGQVRDVQTRVFEHMTKQLPLIIFTMIEYAHPRGFDMVHTDLGEKVSETLTIDYFIAVLDTDKHQLGQLRRIDVYKNNKLLFRVKINNFEWKLRDAPNGDRQDELFSLQDRCFASAPTSRWNLESEPSRIVMELEYLLNQEIDDNERAVDLLIESSIRNQALIRSLWKFDPSLFETHVYNLKFKIGSNKDLIGVVLIL